MECKEQELRKWLVNYFKQELYFPIYYHFKVFEYISDHIWRVGGASECHIKKRDQTIVLIKKSQYVRMYSPLKGHICS